MSFFEDAALLSLPVGGAGKDGKIYNIKPTEKVKDEELVTDPSFLRGTTNWSVGGDIDPTISGGRALFASTLADSDNDYSRIRQTNVFEVGVKYRVVIDAIVTKGEMKVGHNSDNLEAGVVRNSGLTTLYFKATDTDLNIARHTTDAEYNFIVKSVSVKEVEVEPADFDLGRGSDVSATRINSDGKIEKGYENQIRFSNDFGNGSSTWYYSTNDNTVTKGFGGYDGTENAFKYVKASNNNSYIIASSSSAITTTNDEVWTYSVYAKDGGNDEKLHIGIWTSADGDDPEIRHGNAMFNLQGSGSVYSTGQPNTPGETNEFCVAEIERVGATGWYRCSITSNSNMTGQRPRIQAKDSSGAFNSGGTLYIMNAMWNSGTAAAPYVDNTAPKFDDQGTYVPAIVGIKADEPRFDYTNDVGGCPALLLEPQRTNEIEHSEWFRAPYWTSTGMTVTQKYDTSPEGLKNAVLIRPTTTAEDHYIEGGGSFATTDEWLTFSVFAKVPDDGNEFLHISVGASRLYGIFQLSGSGTIKTVNWSNTNYHDDSTDPDEAAKNIDPFGTIEALEDGWYRCSISGMAVANNTSYVRISCASTYVDEHTPDSAGDGEGMLIYGAQVECDDNAYATSYIPNYGTSGGVTRNADTSGRLDISDHTDGKDVTVFVDLETNDDIRRDGSIASFQISAEGSNLGAMRIYRPSSSQLRRFFVYLQDNEGHSENVIVSDLVSNPKIAVTRVWDTGRIKVFVNGSEKKDMVNTDFDAWTKVDIRGGGATARFKEVAVFDRVLTDAECVSLTS